MVQVFGFLPSKYETWIEIELLLQPGPTLAVTGIWGVNQQIGDLCVHVPAFQIKLTHSLIKIITTTNFFLLFQPSILKT